MFPKYFFIPYANYDAVTKFTDENNGQTAHFGNNGKRIVNRTILYLREIESGEGFSIRPTVATPAQIRKFFPEDAHTLPW